MARELVWELSGVISAGKDRRKQPSFTLGTVAGPGTVYGLRRRDQSWRKRGISRIISAEISPRKPASTM